MPTVHHQRHVLGVGFRMRACLVMPCGLPCRAQDGRFARTRGVWPDCSHMDTGPVVGRARGRVAGWLSLTSCVV
jgi:hypothetical protein